MRCGQRKGFLLAHARHRVQFPAIRGVRMDKESPKLQLFCALCGERFFVCVSCYRGQGYCSPECRRPSRVRLKREARARHQRTREGRLDHRDHQRAYRERIALRVTDLGSQKVDAPVDCVPASAPATPISGVLVSTDKGTHDGLPHQPVRAIRCVVCGREGSLILARPHRRRAQTRRHLHLPRSRGPPSWRVVSVTESSDRTGIRS